MEIANRLEMETYILQQYPFEACGVIARDLFIPIENVASSPSECFLMPKGTYIEHEANLSAIVHSHTHDSVMGIDPRLPSMSDMKLAEATGVLQGIYHCTPKGVSPALWFNQKIPPPLIGRNYIPSIFDCYTIVRDYYKLNYDYVLAMLPRTTMWTEDSPTLMLENLENQGLTKVRNIGKLVEGDVLVFCVGSRLPTHVAVYLKDGEFIHHLNGRTSSTDTLIRWSKQFHSAYRLTK